MNDFIYQYPVKQYFGKGCAEDAIKTELKNVGDNVLLAYGGGSLKRTGLYDKLRRWLEEAGKNVTDFDGIMPIRPMPKCRKAHSSSGKTTLILSSLSEAVRSSTAAKLFPPKPSSMKIFGICGMSGIAFRRNLFRWVLS